MADGAPRQQAKTSLSTYLALIGTFVFGFTFRDWVGPGSGWSGNLKIGFVGLVVFVALSALMGLIELLSHVLAGKLLRRGHLRAGRLLLSALTRNHDSRGAVAFIDLAHATYRLGDPYGARDLLSEARTRFAEGSAGDGIVAEHQAIVAALLGSPESAKEFLDRASRIADATGQPELAPHFGRIIAALAGGNPGEARSVAEHYRSLADSQVDPHRRRVSRIVEQFADGASALQLEGWTSREFDSLAGVLGFGSYLRKCGLVQ